MHDRRIIHRDIKPSNFFLTNDLNIKIADFGSSKILNWTGEQAKTFVGSYNYIAPEIFSGEKYSRKIDIWSLGVLIYYLTTLKYPCKVKGATIKITQDKELLGTFSKTI